jgi:hypothetical protein
MALFVNASKAFWPISNLLWIAVHGANVKPVSRRFVRFVGPNARDLGPVRLPACTSSLLSSCTPCHAPAIHVVRE